MSRSYSSYDADWQRRKSVLIRSLFHDIPILSPVEEESSDSYYVPTKEAFASPPRPYSPLPPLIIEKVTINNKHDEPEEHYNKLYRKIKKIYQKLFIQKRNFNSIDYDSNYSDSSINDDSEANKDGYAENLDFHFLESNSTDNEKFDSIIKDRKARQSSASTKSNGYGADFESIDTVMIDVVNYTASNEDVMMSEEEESKDENIDGDEGRNEDSDNSTSSDDKESSREKMGDPEFSGDEESRHSIIDDHEMTEREGHNELDDEQSDEKEGSNVENIDKDEMIIETSQTGQSETVRIDPVLSGEEESLHSSIDDNENTGSEESKETENKLLSSETKSKEDSYEEVLKSTEFEDGNKLIDSNVEPMEGDEETSDCSEGPVYRQITTEAMVHIDGAQGARDRESPVYEESLKSLILPTRFRKVVVRRNVDNDDRIEVLRGSEEHGDIKTVPSFHTDVSETTAEDFEEATPQPDAREERKIKNRTPQAGASEERTSTPRQDAAEADDVEMSSPPPESTEEDAEGIEGPQLASRNEETEEIAKPFPEATEEDVEESISPHSIEEMRTPRPNLSHGTISITHRSHSESTNEHTAVPQEPTALMSSSQDGADHNMSELQTSNDMNEILTSIFNASQNKDGTPISGRKRKLVDKSIQAVPTSRVTWDDMRANFFVGTPKIFRLCACTDHVCY